MDGRGVERRGLGGGGAEWDLRRWWVGYEVRAREEVVGLHLREWMGHSSLLIK